MQIANLVRSVASNFGSTPGQVALAWLMQIRESIVPIPGTMRRTYLEENLAAASLTLSPEDTERRDCESGRVCGGDLSVMAIRLQTEDWRNPTNTSPFQGRAMIGRCGPNRSALLRSARSN